MSELLIPSEVVKPETSQLVTESMSTTSPKCNGSGSTENARKRPYLRHSPFAACAIDHVKKIRTECLSRKSTPQVQSVGESLLIKGRTRDGRSIKLIATSTANLENLEISVCEGGSVISSPANLSVAVETADVRNIVSCGSVLWHFSLEMEKEKKMVVVFHHSNSDSWALSVAVSSRETLIDLKHKLEVMKGIQVDYQRISYKGRYLLNEQRLFDVIEDNSVLELNVVPMERVVVNIHLSDGDFLTVAVKDFVKIEKLKSVVQNERGISAEDQMLFFQGQKLEDGRTLADYGFRNSITLNLVVVPAQRSSPL